MNKKTEQRVIEIYTQIIIFFTKKKNKRKQGKNLKRWLKAKAMRIYDNIQLHLTFSLSFLTPIFCISKQYFQFILYIFFGGFCIYLFHSVSYYYCYYSPQDPWVPSKRITIWGFCIYLFHFACMLFYILFHFFFLSFFSPIYKIYIYIYLSVIVLYWSKLW